MSKSIKNAKKASTAALSRVVEKRHQIQNQTFLVSVLRASELSRTLQEAVWNLFHANMSGLYKSTDVFPWDPVEKRAELFDRSSRFLLVTEESDRPETDLVAYSMFRFDVEETMDGRKEKVLYCYELQVSEASRGCGLGKTLVRILERLGREWCMDKVMLTVLKANTGAVRFYRREEFITDAISPDDVDYFILSKTILTSSS